MFKIFTRWYFLAFMTLGFFQAGCGPPFEEKRIECRGTNHLAAAHLRGQMLILQPRDGSTWVDLVPPHIPPLASAMTIEELREQRGLPDKRWQIDDRPFVLYELPKGTLQLGLEASRSGSVEHRIWRLRWQEAPTKLSEVVSEESFECIGDLARKDQLVVLRSPDNSAPGILVKNGLVVSWSWTRRYEWESSPGI